MGRRIDGFQAKFVEARARRLTTPAVLNSIFRMVSNPTLLSNIGINLQSQLGLKSPAIFDHFRLRARTADAFDTARLALEKSCGFTELGTRDENGRIIVSFKSKKGPVSLELAAPKAEHLLLRRDPELVLEHIAYVVSAEDAGKSLEPMSIRHGGTQCLVVIQDTSLRDTPQSDPQGEQRSASTAKDPSVTELEERVRKNWGLPPKLKTVPTQLPSLNGSPADSSPPLQERTRRPLREKSATSSPIVTYR